MSGKNKRQALGRGLDALLGNAGLDNWQGATAASLLPKSHPVEEKTGRGEVAESHGFSDPEEGVIGALAAIDIRLIEENPKQPRTQFNEQSLRELSESIRQNGIIQPLTVRKNGKKYQLISGERRLKASKMAGLTEVPVYIRMASENQMLEMGLVENIQREDLNAMDIALSYQALVDSFHYSQEEVSQKVGKDRSTVANYLRLLKLPAEVQFALTDNKISMGHARALLGVDDPEVQVEWVRKIIEKGLSVRHIEQGVKQQSAKKSTKILEPKTLVLPEWCIENSRHLSDKLDTLVEVHKGKGGKGSLQIRFSSEVELKKILEQLNA